MGVRSCGSAPARNPVAPHAVSCVNAALKAILPEEQFEVYPAQFTKAPFRYSNIEESATLPMEVQKLDLT